MHAGRGSHPTVSLHGRHRGPQPKFQSTTSSTTRERVQARAESHGPAHDRPDRTPDGSARAPADLPQHGLPPHDLPIMNTEDTSATLADGLATGGTDPAIADAATAAIAWFDGSRLGLLIVLLLVCGAVIACIWRARTGRPVRIRRIAALEAVDEAVGRATEMGRPVLFVPGIMDMNEIQTVAGVTVLGRVATTAAEYDAELEVPTARSLVMTAARETVQAAHFAAGRPETYNPNAINYITDEQFGYVAYLSGKMVREKPAACFYMGAFYAESLVLAENGNSIGAIQIAGTAEPSQLPFFVAACDYTLIGEEFFAASAYLSGERDQLGSIQGQDLGKLLAVVLILVGVGLATAASIAPESSLAGAWDGFRNALGG
ncbi:MAG: hypothetical protein RI967_122 [Planctomycetota bacterium]